MSGGFKSVIMDCGSVVRLIMYKVVWGHLHPLRRTLFVVVFVMVTIPFVKVALHPWLQKVPTDRRDVRRPGKMCAVLAARGSWVHGRSAVWVE